MQLTLQDIIRMMGNPSTVGQVSDIELARMMNPDNVPPAPVEGMPNFAEGRAPLVVGGLLDPNSDKIQMMLNTALDRRNPNIVRANAVNVLRQLGY